MHTTLSHQARQLALIEEVTTAVYLIQEGLVSLNRLDGANDFAHLPILLLSNGFERLLKTIICLDWLKRHGVLPTASDFCPHAHQRVTRLLEKVISVAKGWDYPNRCPATRADMTFLEKDPDLKQIAALLEHYAHAGRYYNLDAVLGKSVSPEDDPIRVFDSYCTKLFTRRPDCQERITGENLSEKTNENIRYVNHQITVLLQKSARALCRMFTLGKLGQAAQQLTGIIGVFLFLKDDDLGRVQPRWFESSRLAH